MTNVLGSRIRKARHLAKLTPEQMAMELGVSVGTLFRYERGEALNLSVGRLARIAAVTEKPMAYFLNGDEEKVA